MHSPHHGNHDESERKRDDLTVVGGNDLPHRLIIASAAYINNR